jgi:hypothetical protein
MANRELPERDRAAGARDTTASDVVARLRARFGPDAFDVTEQWDSDVCVVGVSRPNEAARLVYISTCDLPDGRFDVSIDASGNTDEWPMGPAGVPQRPAHEGHHGNVDFDTVARVVAEHLGISITD